MEKKRNKTLYFGFFALVLTIVLILAISGCNLPNSQVTETPSASVLSATPVNPDPEILPEDVGEAPVEVTPAGLLPTEEAPLHSTEPAGGAQETGNCGRSDTINLLLLGIDKHAQADGIRLIRVDFKNATVKMTSIPRDFYVPIVGFEQFGIDYGRINATFGYGEYFFGPGNGADSIAQNVTYNYGVDFDDQFVLYYDEIGKYIDAIGGITVTTEKRAQDYWYNFPPGTYEMDGETAVIFMRIRAFDTDIQRINRQTLVMEAILHKVREGISPKMIYEVLTTLLKDKTTQTNLGLSDMYSFYCLSRIIDISDIQVSPIPDTMFHPYTTETGAQVLIPHAEVVEFVQDSLDLLN
jgi:LCP family protein required for cell wall assembly